jgi:hypothetical protein
MMSRSISQTTAAISQITTAITTTVMIKLNAPRTLLTSSQLKGRDTPAKDTPARLPTLRVARTTGHANVLDFLVAVRQLDHVPEEVPAVVAQASFWLAL